MTITSLKTLWNRLFCRHDWQCLSHTTIYDEEGYFPVERWVHQCRKCGRTRISTNEPDRRRWFL